ncbi:MAG: hypothetical protein ABIE36_00500 [Candidatus Diapherotrites archaeon]
MSLRRLENIQDGETTEFLQVYINNQPEIFCKKFGDKDSLEEAYSFLKDILRELKISYEVISQESAIPRIFGENYSYEGVGRVAKDKGIIRIWRIPGYSYNKRHLTKYQDKSPNLRFDKNI